MKKTFLPLPTSTAPLWKEFRPESQCPAQKWSRYLYTGRRMNIHGTLFKPPTDSGAYHHHRHRCRHHRRMIYINIFIYETAASGRGKTRTTSGKNYTFCTAVYVQCVSSVENHTELSTRNVPSRVLILNANTKRF